MSHTHWSVTYAALLAITSGCSGGSSGSRAKVALYPVVDERGLVTYVTRNPYDPGAEEERQGVLEREREAAEARRRQEERNYQDLADLREAQKYDVDRRIQQLRQQSEVSAHQVPSRRQQPGWQGNSDFLRSGEIESMRLQQQSQEVDRSLQGLREGRVVDRLGP
ncbi:hypothetical protein SAMN05444166_1252 [Singulisphaera sp. GP187]|uniref:hypothetical protein n=1 Tax=Singulisphaera sp. GP187 TaxID=1882752 RepID=UPI00092685FD|nr:hypothetical protein [Singulisphaera sp. GP187]SIN84845.1 hypothetical protein SAMN05444166_1252 [Singulisphaera sp. GP187]